MENIVVHRKHKTIKWGSSGRDESRNARRNAFAADQHQSLTKYKKHDT